PEEVEEFIKTHHEIKDALVMGVPDFRWGQIVVAVVELENGFTLDEYRLKDFASQALARYKLPRAIFSGGPPFRAPNGKANYKQILEYATQLVAANKEAN
ncbi:MAG: acyl-CoA synthetase, partial [Halieaceae bacterium]|nr:acyl-CoA synthetase [Halieaceae bacterium]